MRTRVDVLSPTDDPLYRLMNQGVDRLVKRQPVVDGVVKNRRRVGDQFYEVSAPVESRGLFSRGPRVTEVTVERSNFDDEKPCLKLVMGGDGSLSLSFTDGFERKSDFSVNDLHRARSEGGQKVIEMDNFSQLQPQTRDVLFGEVRKAFFGI